MHRSQVLNHVILAEINFFQREKVYDFNTYLKQLLHEQIQFYENVNLFEKSVCRLRSIVPCRSLNNCVKQLRHLTEQD